MTPEAHGLGVGLPSDEVAPVHGDEHLRHPGESRGRVLDSGMRRNDDACRPGAGRGPVLDFGMRRNDGLEMILYVQTAPWQDTRGA